MAKLLFNSQVNVMDIMLGFSTSATVAGISQFLNTNTTFSATSTTAVNYVLTSGSNLFVFGGAVPDFSTLTSTTETKLITFPMSAANNSWQSLGVPTTGTPRAEYLFGACTTPTAALASGTATWFAICATYNFTGTFSDRATMFGTIGTIGSGADLEMADTNIVSGGTYMSAGVKLSFPYEWTLQ
jgi:hypothetical protein